MTGFDVPPRSDPTAILRYRDGIYAADLLGTAVIHFDFFDWIFEHNPTLEELCKEFKWAARPAEVLVTLAKANDLVQEASDGRLSLTQLAREHLTKNSPWDLSPYFRSLKDRPVVADFKKVLTTGKPAHWSGNDDAGADWHDSMLEEDFARNFTEAMDCRGVYLGKRLAVRIVDYLSERERVLDVAGGSGVYSCALVANRIGLEAVVLERDPVADIAREKINERDLSERVRVETGDIFTCDWPKECDAHLFSNVMHDWDKPEIETLLRKSRESFGDRDGLILIHEVFLNDDKSGPLPAAEYSSILAHSTQGRCYSHKEMAEMMTEAGFDVLEYRETGGDRGVVIGQINGSSDGE